MELDVQKAKSKLEVSLAQTRVDLAEARQKFTDAKRANPYCLNTEIAAKQEVEALEGGLEYGEKVLAERF